MDIVYDVNGGADFGHPQKVMAFLGIEYEKAEPMPIADRWVFRNCLWYEGVVLPSFITLIESK